MGFGQTENRSSEDWFEAHSIRNLLRAQEGAPKNNNISAEERHRFHRSFEPSVYSSSSGDQETGSWKSSTSHSTSSNLCELTQNYVVGIKRQERLGGFLYMLPSTSNPFDADAGE